MMAQTPDSNPQTRNAVITGATTGIGHAIAEHFLAEGFTILFCARTAKHVAETTKEWAQKFGAEKALGFAADVSKQSEVEEFAQQVLRNTDGRIDVLVNNAGVFMQGDIATEPEGQLRAILDTNLMSAYHLTRALLPAMKANGSGHIFNMCSIASLKAYPGGGAYSISKYALLGFSDNLRNELKPYGLRVTAICPGATWSNSWSGSGVPQERIMEAEDIAKMVWATYNLNAQANVETIVMRPQQGDL